MAYAEGTDEASLALGGQLCFTVYSTAHAFTRLYSELLDRLGLTYTQYLVMLALWEEDGLSVKELGQRLRLDSGTLTPVVRRLENRGLVRRERSQADQRRVHVRLEPTAEALKPEVRRARHRVFEGTGLTFEQLGDLQARLQAVCRSLDQATARRDTAHGDATPSACGLTAPELP